MSIRGSGTRRALCGDRGSPWSPNAPPSRCRVGSQPSLRIPAASASWQRDRSLTRALPLPEEEPRTERSAPDLLQRGADLPSQQVSMIQAQACFPRRQTQAPTFTAKPGIVNAGVGELREVQGSPSWPQCPASPWLSGVRNLHTYDTSVSETLCATAWFCPCRFLYAELKGGTSWWGTEKEVSEVLTQDPNLTCPQDA